MMRTPLLVNERRIDGDALPRPILEELQHVNAIKVLPGESHTAGGPDDLLVTTLGSCVAACIRDPQTGFGGMNHFMLPLSHDGAGNWGGVSRSLRYGNHAMEALINEVLRRGCSRRSLEIKVFGGGNVIGGSSDIGHANARFVLGYLKNEGLTVAAADLGGDRARRIYYYPATGVVKRLILRRAGDDQDVRRGESLYQRRLRGEPEAGEVELFTE